MAAEALDNPRAELEEVLRRYIRDHDSVVLQGLQGSGRTHTLQQTFRAQEEEWREGGALPIYLNPQNVTDELFAKCFDPKHEPLVPEASEVFRKHQGSSKAQKKDVIVQSLQKSGRKLSIFIDDCEKLKPSDAQLLSELLADPNVILVGSIESLSNKNLRALVKQHRIDVKLVPMLSDKGKVKLFESLTEGLKLREDEELWAKAQRAMRRIIGLPGQIKDVAEKAGAYHTAEEQHEAIQRQIERNSLGPPVYLQEKLIGLALVGMVLGFVSLKGSLDPGTAVIGIIIAASCIALYRMSRMLGR